VWEEKDGNTLFRRNQITISPITQKSTVAKLSMFVFAFACLVVSKECVFWQENSSPFLCYIVPSFIIRAHALPTQPESNSNPPSIDTVTFTPMLLQMAMLSTYVATQILCSPTQIVDIPSEFVVGIVHAPDNCSLF
jgi:magnesium-transporting ATPase (P-type)